MLYLINDAPDPLFMTFLLALASSIVLFLASVTVILFFVGPTLLLKPRRRGAEFYRALGLPTLPSDTGLEYESIGLRTDDGLNLKCWLIKAPPGSSGTILYLHGVGDCKIDGIRLAKLLHVHGFNVFLYDSRRHGESDGACCTYGFYEKRDVSAIIDALERRSDLALGKIGIFGTSMGAAVALQAGALDRRVAAIVAENSFATLRSIFDDYQRRMIKLPFHFLRNLVIHRSEIIAGFKARDVSPLEAVAAIRVPVLFVYGENDRLINHQYSISLYENMKGQKDIFPIEQASHNNAWEIAGEAYEQKIVGFFERNLR